MHSPEAVTSVQGIMVLQCTTLKVNMKMYCCHGNGTCTTYISWSYIIQATMLVAVIYCLRPFAVVGDGCYGDGTGPLKCVTKY